MRINKSFIALAFAIYVMVPVFVFAQSADVTSGLVGSWNFDEEGGTVATDSSGNNNPGALVGGPEWVMGKSGKALSFDGVDDYVDIGDKATLDNFQDMSISLWLQTNVSQIGVLVNKYENGANNGYYLAIGNKFSSSDKITFFVDGSSEDKFFTDNGVINGQWHHIAAVYKSGVGPKIYIDGSEQSGSREGVAQSSIGTAPGRSFRIGQYSPGGYNFYYKGLMDEVKVYNRALTSSDVGALYSGSAASTPAPTLSSFTANPTTVSYNTPTSLSWTTSGNADYCEASDGWTGQKAVSGSSVSTGNLTTTTTFSLRCHGAGGFSSIQSVTVNVGTPSVPTVTLSANPTTVAYNTPTYLTWSASGVGVDYCTASNGWSGQKAMSGSSVATQSLITTTIFSIQCHGTGGLSSVQSITVTVASSPTPTPQPNPTPTPSPTPTPTPIGLIGSWNFDEGAGDMVNDSSGNNNQGVLVGNPTWVSGRFGKALSFDGIDDYVEMGDKQILNITKEISLSLWLKANTSQIGTLINKYDVNSPDNGYYLRLKGGTISTMFISNDSTNEFVTNQSVLDYQWHHIVVTYKSDGVSSAKIYIDGIQQSGTNIGPLLTSIGASTGYNFRIGRYSSDAASI
ncbi:MAG: laminin G domain-containing protein, partial [Parcubacteria group bacterium]|nr:laminin G domain-containing protein [Parcubacteria group bacterium]